MHADVTKVIGSEIKGGYRYVAILADGSSAIVRAKSTTRYAFAFQWDTVAASGKSGLAAYFSYSGRATGAKNNWASKAVPIGVFAIEWPAA